MDRRRRYGLPAKGPHPGRVKIALIMFVAVVGAAQQIGELDPCLAAIVFDTAGDFRPQVRHCVGQGLRVVKAAVETFTERQRRESRIDVAGVGIVDHVEERLRESS